MKLDDYSYSNMFQNTFSPHLKLLSFNWNNFQTSSIQSELTENFSEKTEPVEEENQVEEESKDIEPIEKSVSYEIKNITPKKHFWRK